MVHYCPDTNPSIASCTTRLSTLIPLLLRPAIRLAWLCFRSFALPHCSSSHSPLNVHRMRHLPRSRARAD
ncbi:hypothetical protein A4X13_0g20 [Tilletia indica]|uniref:Uncharacterized protein n=1 Tax=Tilletia indica TaxID=43049 RepID=A0A177TNZ5_9BASI|nr:hypothetical protein A4X13_0g20 [Tilletia indica]